MDTARIHWEKIYNSKADIEVSWYQANPGTSLSLIERCCQGDKAKLIADIGGGNSLLVRDLAQKKYTNLCVVDISETALERSRNRIPTAKVNWITGDILECELPTPIDIWHDRAVFHFLTIPQAIEKYVSVVCNAVPVEGFFILGTFSETGPDKCSGLPVSHYSEIKFRKLFEPGFELQDCFEEIHITPSGTAQNFIWGVFKRK